MCVCACVHVCVVVVMGGSSWTLGGVFVCICVCAVGGGGGGGGGVFWRQSSSLSTGACWTQHLVLSLPPRLCFFPFI